jgi:hypothetical protein
MHRKIKASKVFSNIFIFLFIKTRFFYLGANQNSIIFVGGKIPGRICLPKTKNNHKYNLMALDKKIVR